MASKSFPAHGYQPMLLSRNTNAASFDGYSAPDPSENRHIAVADVTIRPTYVLHAPQPRYPYIDTMTTSCSSVGNKATGLSISRPPAPILNHLQSRHTLWYNSTSCSGSSHPDRPDINEHDGTHPCYWDSEGTPCGHELQTVSKDILAHFRQHHRIDVNPEGSFTCSWITPDVGSGHCGKKLKIDSFGRHIITHLRIKFRCSICSKKMAARSDLVTKHCREYLACSQATFDTITD